MDDYIVSIFSLTAAIVERAKLDASKNYSGIPASCEATTKFHNARDCANRFLAAMERNAMLADIGAFDTVGYCIEVFSYALPRRNTAISVIRQSESSKSQTYKNRIHDADLSAKVS